MGNPEPDRQEFHGAIAEHIYANWGKIPRRMRGAILEAVTSDPPHNSVKFAAGCGLSIGSDGKTYARGTGGRFVSHEAWKNQFNELCNNPPIAWRSKDERAVWDW